MKKSYLNQRKGEVCKELGVELSRYLDDDHARFWELVKVNATRPDGTTIPPCEVEAVHAAMARALVTLAIESGEARVIALQFFIYRLQVEGPADANADELLFRAMFAGRKEGSLEERMDYVVKLFQLRLGEERSERLNETLKRRFEELGDATASR